MKNAVVLMTALVPTTGHLDLIEWAANLPETHVHVIVNTRSFEPVCGGLRGRALQEATAYLGNVTVYVDECDDAPQNPEDHSDFWGWWRDSINSTVPTVNGDWRYVVASEPYGEHVATALGAQFMPYDLNRTLNPVRGVDVRTDPIAGWEQIVRAVREQYQLRAVMFGQESVGKTTISKLVAERLDGTWGFEFARPYLEAVGPELSSQVMENIHAGQAALQRKLAHAASKPFTVLDTDLFSTVGYYGLHEYAENKRLPVDAVALKSDVYYLLPDNVPFEEDQLRYGGDVRESDMTYWLDILKRFDLPHVVVPCGSLQEKVDFIVNDVLAKFELRWDEIKSFVRE